MTKTEELYRKPPSYFKDMKALEASKEKINLAKAHLWDLLSTPLSQRDFGLIIKLQKAMSHHEFLVEEEDEETIRGLTVKKSNIFRGTSVLSVEPSDSTFTYFESGGYYND